MKKVIVFGTFDILHPGHIHLLREAKTPGDYLVVVIARDKTVLEVKHKTPKNSEKIRMQNMKNLGLADKVMLGSLIDKFQVIKDEKPAVIALGYDQKIPVDDLEKKVGEGVKIIRLTAYKPDVYKSSKLTEPILSE
jgi:cytidyltransferase-like protein